MAKKSMKELAKEMKDIDICMFSTMTQRGVLSSRPMSNNREVEYDGNSYYYTFEQSRTVATIKEHPQVNLSFQGSKDLYISISGKANLVHSRAILAEHWTDGLNMWFPQGVDTPGIVMIHVIASHIKYWSKDEEGEVTM